MRNLLLLPFLAVLLAPPPAAAQLTNPPKAAQPAPANTTKNRVVSGLVTDQTSRDPLPGVTVLIKGTNLGTSTDAQGRYSLLVPDAARAVLLFNYLGYLPVARAVGKGHTLNLSLRADNKQLSEVVVTAKGIEPQRQRLSYSVTSVAPAMADGLAGKAAGVQIRSANRAGKAKRGRPMPGYELADSETTPGQPRPSLPARQEAGAGDTA